MSVTYGFYNAFNHDRLYDAMQISSMFDGLIEDGIYMSIGQKFEVKVSEGMTVTVGTGRAWFDHTWTLNDALLPITLPDPEVIFDRIDAIVIEVNSSVDVRENSIKVVKGTPDTNPVRPTLEHSDSINQYALAYITVKKNVEAIVQADITSAVGLSETPYVVGLLQKTDIDALMAQWLSQYDEFWTAYDSRAEVYWENYRGVMQDQLENYIDGVTNAWNTWFSGFRDDLDPTAAVGLANAIETLREEISNFKIDITEQEFRNHYGLSNSTTTVTNTDDRGTVINTEGEDADTEVAISQLPDGTDVITTSVIPKTGSWNYISTTTLVEETNTVTIKTIYTKTYKGV